MFRATQSISTLKPPKIDQNGPKSPRTETGTSGTTRVRAWLGTSFKDCTRTCPSSEAYDLLKTVGGLSNAELAEAFTAGAYTRPLFCST